MSFDGQHGQKAVSCGQYGRGKPRHSGCREEGEGRGHRKDDNMNRNEAAQAIAKVFAYLAVNKPDVARAWAQKLIAWLEMI